MNTNAPGARMAFRYPIEPTPMAHGKRSSLGAKFCYALLALYAALIPWAAYLFIARHK